MIERDVERRCVSKVCEIKLCMIKPFVTKLSMIMFFETRLFKTKPSKIKLSVTRCNTEVNAIISPLLGLPVEIRNSIFAYVFKDIEYQFNHGVIHEDETTCGGSFNGCNLGLIAVSRQVHAETSLLPYKLAQFRFHFECPQEDWTYCVERFVEKRSKQQEQALGTNMRVSEFDEDLDDVVHYYGTSAWAI
ncbi:hypothetical protein J4E89_009076 [Alternaria sp. Ai002NY15]|nr:hypothetical protein J4E89_009076 [Alternaria sp. Ai002NY15]